VVASVVAGGETRLLHELTGWALSRGVPLDGLTVDRPSLEDVYLRLTGTAAGAVPPQPDGARPVASV